MLPIFGDDRRRPINLGGTSTASSHAAILDQAKARRTERQDARNRLLAAVKIQAWWRGMLASKMVRMELRGLLNEDVEGLTGLRCLVVLRKDEEALGMWSERVGEEGVFKLAAGSTGESWKVLIRRTSLMLLQSVANAPQ